MMAKKATIEPAATVEPVRDASRRRRAIWIGGTSAVAAAALFAGTLLLSDLKPARHLYLLATGTGLAPFLSLIRDPDAYERFDKIVLTHGVRQMNDLAYRDYIQQELPQHEYLGDMVREKLIYYPTVTREPFHNQGRLDALLASGKLCADIGLPPLDPADDRAMICGSPAMLASLSALLDSRGFVVSPRIGTPGDYVIERAFVEK